MKNIQLDQLQWVEMNWSINVHHVFIIWIDNSILNTTATEFLLAEQNYSILVLLFLVVQDHDAKTKEAHN